MTRYDTHAAAIAALKALIGWNFARIVQVHGAPDYWVIEASNSVFGWRLL